jgi:hypothetical protein
MPYPAYSYLGQAFLPGEFTAYGETTSHDVAARIVWEGNAASTNNPLRFDKTRGMAPFQRWGSRLITDAFIKVGSYYYPWEQFEYFGPFPALPMPQDLRVWVGGTDQAVLNAFASWGEEKVAYSAAMQQAGKTARMVGDLGKGISHGIDNLMHKHTRGKYGREVMRNWKKLPGWYLEYLYGWKPLADDIENAVRELSEGILFGDSLHLILKGRWKGIGEKVVLVTGSPFAAGWDAEYTLQVEQRCKAQFRYDIPNSGLENVQPLGFFGSLWEGSPYSFVADWIAPIGTWLNALDANALAPYFTEGCVSEYLKTTSIGKKIVARAGWTLSVQDRSSLIGIKPYSFTRVLRGPYTVNVRIPIRNPLNLNHAAQGLSLLTQALKRWY